MTKNLLFLFFKTTKQKLHPQEPETAQKKLAEIGSQLRQYREQQSICLDKVAVVTMIRRNLLQAIEDGQLDQLPEPVYTQGLIKRYAEAMGLDAAQFANFFPIEPPRRSTAKLSWQDGPQLRPNNSESLESPKKLFLKQTNSSLQQSPRIKVNR